MRPFPKLDVRNITRTPEEDKSLVGISFVDVLFALVVGQVLSVATRWDELTAPGVLHLILAFVLTVTSWIGYHNSKNRLGYSIRFANLPLLQFGVDVALVLVYWLTANYVDGIDREQSMLPETYLVTGSFFLYFLWDRIVLLMRGSHAYPDLKEKDDNKNRRYVTELFLLLSLLTIAGVQLMPSESRPWLVGVDAWLILLLFAYRFAKEATPSTGGPRSG